MKDSFFKMGRQLLLYKKRKLKYKHIVAAGLKLKIRFHLFHYEITLKIIIQHQSNFIIKNKIFIHLHAL